jgi:hypothetical protein
MDYGQIYANLIEKGLTRNLGDGVYFEKHHVWPKCMGGPDDESNLVKLTPEEHYLVHQLLVKMFPNNNKLVYACFAMCIDAKGKRVNNKMYGWIKRKDAKVKSETLKGVKKPPRSEEHRRRMSEAQKNRVRYPSSEETKLKMSEAKKGKKQSLEHIANAQAAKKRNRELKNLTSQ